MKLFFLLPLILAGCFPSEPTSVDKANNASASKQLTDVIVDADFNFVSERIVDLRVAPSAYEWPLSLSVSLVDSTPSNETNNALTLNVSVYSDNDVQTITLPGHVETILVKLSAPHDTEPFFKQRMSIQSVHQLTIYP